MKTSDQAFRSSRIVIVDDTPVNVLLLQTMLEEDGYERIETYTDPVAATAAIVESPPDLVLLDIRMPFLDGHQVMARLANEVKEYLPIIVLTAQTDEETRLKALAGGAKDFLSKPFDQEEVLHRIRNTLETKLAYNERREQASILEEVVDERTRELTYMANHDLVTGLPNRACLRRKLGELEGEGTILLVSVERLDTVVDALGPAKGETVLHVCAEELRKRFPEEVVVGCWGGTDLLICAPNRSVEETAPEVTSFFSEPLMCEDDLEVVLAARIGACSYPDDGTDADLLVKRAGLAMITARRLGVESSVFNVSLEEEAARRHRIERELRKAIDREELTLYYQPKVRLSDGLAIGMEALVRWTHPEMGFVSPADFIPVAEETGAVVPVGEWVLKRAISDCVKWREAGYDIMVAVNVSGRQFDGVDLTSIIRDLLEKNKLAPEGLEVEITESALLRDLTQAKAVLNAIRELGIAIAIDDFGTGYSSLAYLRQLPLTTLKVDQSFIRYLDKNPDDQALTRTIVKMAHSLGLEAVAEGIEAEVHANFLRELDCEIGQGYMFAKPMPADAFTKWLAENPVRKFS